MQTDHQHYAEPCNKCTAGIHAPDCHDKPESHVCDNECFYGKGKKYEYPVEKVDAIHKIGEHGAIGFETKDGIVCGECGKKVDAPKEDEKWVGEFEEIYRDCVNCSQHGADYFKSFISLKISEAKSEGYEEGQEDCKMNHSPKDLCGKEEGRAEERARVRGIVEGLKKKYSPYVRNKALPENMPTTLTNAEREGYNSALEDLLRDIDK